jgi:hypothetical protein
MDGSVYNYVCWYFSVIWSAFHVVQEKWQYLEFRYVNILRSEHA